MKTEYEWIKLIASQFKKSADQYNGLFESDAEILNLDGKPWAVTIDDFSQDEDLFIFDDAASLGHNLAVATLSDLFAVGALPRFFMQACAFPSHTDPMFIEKLMQGVRAVLDLTNCALCGGDIGKADPWRYVGTAFGSIPQGVSLNRILPVKPQTLWVTGTLGDANLAAFTKQNTPLFECRFQASQVIAQYASACIDTSGGFFDAIWTLHALQPNLAIDIDLDQIPYHPKLKAMTEAMELPIETALMGGAGEYELLFAIPEDEESLFINAMEKDTVTQVGKVTPSTTSRLVCHKDKQTLPFTKEPLCPRSFQSLEAYITALIQMTRDTFPCDK